MCESDLSETTEVRKLGSKASFIEILKEVAAKIPDPEIGILQGAWESLVGQELAHRSRPIELKRNELIIECEASWVDSMGSLKPQILRKINYRSPWNFQKLTFIEGEFTPFIKPISGAQEFNALEDAHFDEIMTQSQTNMEGLDEETKILAASILKKIILDK